MTTTILSTEIDVSVEPLFTEGERITLAGFLAGYSGVTRGAYALDLRMFTAWCQQHDLHLFQARRADIECFGRDMEARGRARATIGWWLPRPASGARCPPLASIQIAVTRSPNGADSAVTASLSRRFRVVRWIVGR